MESLTAVHMQTPPVSRERRSHRNDMQHFITVVPRISATLHDLSVLRDLCNRTRLVQTRTP